jgi:hypothetical protein
MDRVEVRRACRSRGVPVVLLALAVGVLWAAARYGPASSDQVEQWAVLPGDVEPRPGAATRPPRGAKQALRPRCPRPHTPLTWEQERELTRSDVHSLCARAREMADAFDDEGDVRLGDGRSTTAEAMGVEVRECLIGVAQGESRLQEQLDRARGPSDLFAVQQEAGRVRGVVNRAQLWLRARRMVGAQAVPRCDETGGDCAGRARDLPPGPGREEAGHRP